MIVREAEPADAEEIRRVHYASIRELGTQAYSQEQVEAWASGCESADYTSVVESDELECVVAEADGEIVGFGTLKIGTPAEYEAEADAEVTGVYVHPSAAREGVGTRIYTDLERRARSHDVQVLRLSASRNAVSFYEAHGYERVREYTHEFSSHESTGVTGEVVEMRKDL